MKFTINKVELEADGTDIEFVERFEHALEQVKPIAKAESLPRLESLKLIETCIRNFFTELYGEEVCVAIFTGQRRNIRTYLSAFGEVRRAYDNDPDLLAEINDLTSRFA